MVQGRAIMRGRDYGSATSQQRHDHACGPSNNTAIKGFDLGAERASSPQSENGGEVKEAGLCLECADGPKGGPLERSELRGRGDGRAFPEAHAAAD